MLEASEVLAAKMEELVLELTAAFPEAMPVARDVEAARTVELVLELTEAVSPVTSDWVAKEPEERPAPVRVRVPKLQTWEAVRPFELVASCNPIEPGVVRVVVATFHTSAARVPKVVRDLAVLAQTAVGMVARSDVEAVRTVASVCELMVEMAVVNWEFVLELTLVAIPEMLEPREVEAARTVELVFELTLAFPEAMPVAREVLAARTAELVLELTLAVPAVIAEASEEEAVSVCALTAVVIPAV
jgi:hypothetical protein